MKPNRLLPATAAEWLEFAFQSVESYSARAEERHETRLALQLLLAHALGKTRAWVIAHPEAPLSTGESAVLEGLLQRYASGTPLPYLLGRWEFYGLSFTVTPDTLIPRPETEILVDEAIAWLRAHPSRCMAADAGTGSGCIAISVAHNIPDLRVIAVDQSRAALRIARQNATEHHTQARIAFVQGDLLRAVSGPFDLVCANLPYIPTAALEELPVAKSEPASALDGGPDGLALIRTLVMDAPRWLAPGGLLLLEMQFDQGEAIQALLREALPDARVSVLPDLAGLPRLVRAERVVQVNHSR